MTSRFTDSSLSDTDSVPSDVTAAIPDDLLVVTEEEGAEPVKRRTGVCVCL